MDVRDGMTTTLAGTTARGPGARGLTARAPLPARGGARRGPGGLDGMRRVRPPTAEVGPRAHARLRRAAADPRGWGAGPMAPRRGPAQSVGMARLLVLWSLPQHLAEREAEAWIGAEVDRLLARDGIARARLTRLRGASPGCRQAADWLLELELGPELLARRDDSAWREWLADLRLLGMRPAAMLADEGRLLGPQAGP